MFTTCNWENPVIKKWWTEEEEQPPELYYIAILKNIGTYDTIIEERIVYEQIIIKSDPEIIYVTLPPEVITEIVYEEHTTYVDVEHYVEVEKIVTITMPPDKETFIEWLTEEATPADKEEIIKILIKDIEPEELIKYLTDEQIKYIISQQPPQFVLQSIEIIGIEYIIFSGDSRVYNGNSPTVGGTSLIDKEKEYNDSTVASVALALANNPDYFIMLHGHANPTTFTDGETVELMQLSMDRANAVKVILNNVVKETEATETNNGAVVGVKTYPGGIPEEIITVSGYCGQKNLFGNNTMYTALNRRVEMILFRIKTTTS